MQKARLLVLDGHSLAFRAFHALRDVERFRTATGQATNAVHGFTQMLIKMIKTHAPSHLAVAFDLSRRSFRTEVYPEYKATREETPVDFYGQVELIQELLGAAGITCLTKENYEADDIVATLARMGSESGLEVLISSGDRDTFQLVNDTVTVLYPGTSISNLTLMTPDEVQKRYNVPPARHPELAALVGEKSDNLPGVFGVGDKTAAEWLNQFDGLDNLLEHANDIKGKRGEALRESIDLVRRNRQLNRLRDDVELGVDIDDLRWETADRDEILRVFDALEFRALRAPFLAVLPAGIPSVGKEEPRSWEPVALGNEVSPGQLSSWLATLNGLCGLDVIADKRSGEAKMLAIAGECAGILIDLITLVPADDKALAEWLADPAQPKIMHEAKQARHSLRARGMELAGLVQDTALAAYLVNPDSRGYELEHLYPIYLGKHLPQANPEGTLELEVDHGRHVYVASDLLVLSTKLNELLVEQGMEAVLRDIELPLQEVLFQMETAGIAIDTQELQALLEDLRHVVNDAQAQAFATIGQEVNLSSPKQLQEVLFDQLDMPKTRKTKTGYTTNAEALNELYARTKHPFLAALLFHREVNKLMQVVESLARAVKPDSRVHTTFQQNVAATGRLSSTDPNLQNIPTRTEEGRRIRQVFYAPAPQSLLTADYSQIEMRIMAHLSGDENLIEAFNSGEDLHRSVAAIVFGLKPAAVTAEHRSRIKAVSYGLAYGLSAFGLSKQLGVDVGEANRLMDRYFDRFGKVRDYLDSVVDEARSLGYTETMFGRRRYLPDLVSDNRQLREMAGRAALNAPIQGSAADLIKIAMLEVHRQLLTAPHLGQMLLQVHDELVLEVNAGQEQELAELVMNAMQGAATLKVPLEVSTGFGRTWREAAH